MPPARPVQTALIGLSSSAVTAWAADAHLPVLVNARYKHLFNITALCNSSVAAAKSAIQTYQLDSSWVRAYGSPEDLAADPAVDLVLCNTRADKHYETILPSLRAGKSVYIEWPIASNLTQIDELVAAFRASTNPLQVAAVGLQGRFSPAVLKMKELLHSGSLGRLLGTEVTAYAGTQSPDVLSTGLKYFAQKEVGGNPITIGFSHLIDWVQSVVGDVVPETEHVHFQLQHPEIRVRDPRTGELVEKFASDVPDLLSLHGSLPESSFAVPKATLVAYFSRGRPFPGDPAISWTLNCERGTIRFVSPSSTALHVNGYEAPITITVHQFKANRLEQVPWTWSEAQLEFPLRARSTQDCLVALVEGNKERYVSLEDGAKRARQTLRWLGSFQGQK
ncbi:hypothetical protein UA08_04941 [Talaromyces atroroseus]|uniref:Uncharacterized protein n=1 Tax=Talaromyces atroroseus TaxID=1441469 RepID=A0A225AWT7_TALAT|nr:hypothetical protein UA08_04941 [Talaromyces atroroseus]OKL60079.1 hypothetical protein UA08_04941 [Talaromyces atroroseus]